MKRLLNFSLFSLFSALAATSHAEYRAFELKIDDAEKNKSRTITSTLDHLQYPKYFSLAKNEVISYVDSWMCLENMANFKPPCPKPGPTALPTNPKPNSSQKP